MNINKQDYDITRVLKQELSKRNNPKDLKAVHIGTVVQLSPVQVSLFEGKILLTENDDLYISEWFRFRCDIDKTTALSSGVPDDLSTSASNCDHAKQVTETHSYTGSACQMPSAISYLASAIASTNSAITKVNTELLQLKCDLKVGDYVFIGSLEQLDRYILIDKVLDDVPAIS